MKKNDKYQAKANKSRNIKNTTVKKKDKYQDKTSRSKNPKNAPVELPVTEMDSHGNGILYDDLNRRIVVKNLVRGDVAKVQVVERKEFGFLGELVSLIKPAEERATPFCPVFGKCGGCNLQHITYDAQKQFKTSIVKRSMKRFADRLIPVEPIIGMANPFYYRNKVQYPVGIQGGKPAIGFYGDHSYSIVPNNGCFIQHKEADIIKNILLKHIVKHKIEPYNYEKSSGTIRYLMTRKGFASGEIMVILVCNSTFIPEKNELIQALIEAVPAIKSIVVNTNHRNTNVILGDQNTTFFGSDTIKDSIGGINFEISPHSFYQTNPVQTEVLYNTIKKLGNFKNTDIVFDLYSGIGAIALFIAKSVKGIYGIEMNKQAVADAKQNALSNNIKNAQFMVGKSETAIHHLFKAGIRPNKIILDPPRDGCDKNLLKQIAGSSIPEIIYVSCNHETLGRDLGILEQLGYRTETIQPVDMFPHTLHIETVAKITKR